MTCCGAYSKPSRQDNIPSAIIPGSAPFTSDFRAAGATVTSGNIEATQGADGTLTITRVSDGAVLLTETARSFASGQSGAVSNVTFGFPSSKKLYGMGQNRLQDNGGGLGLNVLGHTYSFQGSIGEEGGPSNSLPYVIGGSPSSGFAFGLLFNSPSLGGVSFTNTSMTWSIIADDGNQFLRRQFDFLVSTHAANATAAERAFQITEKYVDAVGHARKMPYPGYWHSKNRYSSQEELLTAARGFHNRSIPVDVIVIDWCVSLRCRQLNPRGGSGSSITPSPTRVTGFTGRSWVIGASTRTPGPILKPWSTSVALTAWKSWSRWVIATAQPHPKFNVVN